MLSEQIANIWDRNQTKESLGSRYYRYYSTVNSLSVGVVCTQLWDIRLYGCKSCFPPPELNSNESFQVWEKFWSTGESVIVVPPRSLSGWSASHASSTNRMLVNELRLCWLVGGVVILVIGGLANWNRESLVLSPARALVRSVVAHYRLSEGSACEGKTETEEERQEK